MRQYLTESQSTIWVFSKGDYFPHPNAPILAYRTNH